VFLTLTLSSFFLLMLLERPSPRKFKDSVVSNRIGVKFGKTVPRVNTHWLTEFGFSIWRHTFKMAAMTSFHVRLAVRLPAECDVTVNFWCIVHSYLKVKVVYSFWWNAISQLWGVTCHMWSHSVTSHPTQVKWTQSALTPARQAGYLPRRERRLSWPRWLVTYRDGLPRPQTVTHPSSNRAQCRLTRLIEANALTTTPRRHLLSVL